MALTYDQHKAAIDAAYPTPPVDWVRQDDHVNFGHHEVASVCPGFQRRGLPLSRLALPRRRRRDLEDSASSGRTGYGDMLVVYSRLGMMRR